ncbi:MAG: hypothetical protein ACOYN3_00665 [Acidimicrobiia bacterium]
MSPAHKASSKHRPRAERDPSIVHLGTGHFGRAHLAVLADRVGRRIIAVSPKSSDLRHQLEPFGFEYDVITRYSDPSIAGGVGVSSERVRSIADVLIAPEDPAAVVEAIARPDTKLVTLTITQNGYYYNPALGLAVDHDDVVQCLQAELPNTAIGMVAHGLHRRFEAGLDPVVVMSLDNIVDNGDCLRLAVISYVEHRKDTPVQGHEWGDNTAFLDWLRSRVLFPNTMVDRIVETTSESHCEWLANYDPELASRNPWPVFTEPMPMHPLIISGHGDHPVLREFTKVGAELVDGVTQHAMMKIRILNGAHVALGMLGRLRGYNFTAEAMADPIVHAFIAGFLDEAIPTVALNTSANAGLSPQALRKYGDEVLQRLTNTAMADSLERLARNGYEKLPERILDPLTDTFAHGLPNDHLLMSVGLWTLYLEAHRAERFNILDPVAVGAGLTSQQLPDELYSNAGAFLSQVAPARRLRTDTKLTEAFRRVIGAAGPNQIVDQLQAGLNSARILTGPFGRSGIGGGSGFEATVQPATVHLGTQQYFRTAPRRLSNSEGLGWR